MLTDSLVAACFVRGADLNADRLLKVLYNFWRQFIGRSTSAHINVHFESYQGRHESLILANQHDIATSRARLFEEVLDGDGCNVLAARRDYQLLNAPRDLEMLIVVNSALVASCKVTVLVNAFQGGFIVLKVAHHNMPAFDSNLALALLVRVRNFDVAARHALTCVLQTKVIHEVDCGATGRLTETVHVLQWDVQ